MSKLRQQSGMVSIIVATMLIIIVSLIVLAFAQVSRREQRESLDAQLSTQAYYAAETGVNAANAVIQATDPTLLTAQPDCQAASGSFSSITYNIDPSHNVAITCLIVDPAPPNLHYTLSRSTANVVPVIPASGAPIRSLTFSWPKQEGLNQSYTTCQSSFANGAWKLPSESTWNDTWVCPYAAIRADFVNADSGLNRNSLLSNDQVSFMLPVANGGGNGVLNNVSPTTCDESTCNITFTNLNHNKMYLRLLSMYREGETVTISGTDTLGQPINFTDAQAKIDATGRAQDVLRRIVVSAPLFQSNNTSPIQALVSGDSVCKRTSVFTGYYQNSANGLNLGCDD